MFANKEIAKNIMYIYAIILVLNYILEPPSNYENVSKKEKKTSQPRRFL